MIKQRSSTNYVVVHSTGTTQNHPDSFFDFCALSRKFGYLTVGHHKIILRDGTVMQGRRDDECGGHLRGFNHNSMSILMVGGLGPIGPDYTSDQWGALLETLIQIKESYPDAVIRGAGELGKPRGQDRETPYFNVAEYINQIGLGD